MKAVYCFLFEINKREINETKWKQIKEGKKMAQSKH